MRNYESVIVLTPLLSEEQMKEAIAKFRAILTDNSSEIVHEDSWGLKKLAYPIQNKSTAYYHLVEYKAKPELIAKLETELKRDERVMRFLTVALDKFAVDYNLRKSKGLIGLNRTDNKSKTETVEK